MTFGSCRHRYLKPRVRSCTLGGRFYNDDRSCCAAFLLYIISAQRHQCRQELQNRPLSLNYAFPVAFATSGSMRIDVRLFHYVSNLRSWSFFVAFSLVNEYHTWLAAIA